MVFRQVKSFGLDSLLVRKSTTFKPVSDSTLCLPRLSTPRGPARSGQSLLPLDSLERGLWLSGCLDSADPCPLRVSWAPAWVLLP